jgi:hypothetical protein
VSPRCQARELQGHANRFGAARCKQHFVQITGRELGQSARQVDGVVIGESAR